MLKKKSGLLLAFLIICTKSFVSAHAYVVMLISQVKTRLCQNTIITSCVATTMVNNNKRPLGGKGQIKS